MQLMFYIVLYLLGFLAIIYKYGIVLKPNLFKDQVLLSTFVVKMSNNNPYSVDNKAR